MFHLVKFQQILVCFLMIVLTFVQGVVDHLWCHLCLGVQNGAFFQNSRIVDYLTGFQHSTSFGFFPEDFRALDVISAGWKLSFSLTLYFILVFARNFANLFSRFLSLRCRGLSYSGYAWFVVGVSSSMFCGCAISTLWSLWLFSCSSSSLSEVSKTGWDCLLFGNWQ